MLKYDGPLEVSCIYKVTEHCTGKIYVGQTINFKARLRKYSCVARSEERFVAEAWWIKHAMIFYYPIDLFNDYDFEVIELVPDVSKLNEREIYWIDALDARNPEVGYNIMPGGTGHVPYGKRVMKNPYYYTLSKKPRSTRRKEAGVAFPKMIYAYNTKTSEVDLYFSGRSADDAFGYKNGRCSTATAVGAKIDDRFFYYFDDKLRRKAADKMIDKQYKIINKYLPIMQSDIHDHSDYTANKAIKILCRYLRGLIAVELDSKRHIALSYDKDRSSYYDNYIKKITDLISNTEVLIPEPYLAYRIEVEAKHACIRECVAAGKPLPPNITPKGNCIPLVIYDYKTDKCKAFTTRKEAASYYGIKTADVITRHLNDGTPMRKHLYAYYIDPDKREDVYRLVRNRQKSTSKDRSNCGCYIKGYFAVKKFCGFGKLQTLF